jgi:spermidine synthase
VVVAEILEAVITWNRNPLFNLSMDSMEDPRVSVVQQDVAEVIRETRNGLDSIILDVDNGPTALSTERNRRLYDRTGLQWMRTALRPGGCVAIWSVAPDPAFEKLMASAGFQVDVQYCRSHPKSGRWHTLILGRVK